MYRLGITLFLIILTLSSLRAQDSLRLLETDSLPPVQIDSLIPEPVNNPRMAQTDSLTYRQYLDGDFRNLIETSRKARQEGINFYYLNYRTAIAYDALKNYAKAADFYKKTLSETPDDPTLKESLYYAYLLSGQKENAAILARTMAPHTQAIVGYTPSVMDHISLSGGYMTNDNIPDLLSNTVFDSLNQYQDMIFSALDIGFKLSERAKLKLGYQLYRTHFQGTAGTLLSREKQLAQHQLVAALEFFTPDNVTWGFAGGYYNIERNDAGKNINYSLTAFLNKRFTYTVPEIAVSYSNFGGIDQYQAKGSLTYYPLGNLNFYGITSAAVIYNPDSWTTEQYIFSQHFGMKLSGPLWLDANGSLGNHLNYISERSFLVFDTYDPIKTLAGLSLSLYLKKMTLSTGYQWQQKEGYAFSATNYTPYKYNNHLLNIALSWNF